MEVMGWIGSVLLAFCGAPELCKSLKSGRCALSTSFLVLWLLGEIFILIPIMGKDLGMFLVFNYTINIIIIVWLLIIKMRSK